MIVAQLVLQYPTLSNVPIAGVDPTTLQSIPQRKASCFNHPEYAVSECTFLSGSPGFPKQRCFWNFPRLRSFVLLVRATCRWRWAWKFGGIIKTRENRVMRRKTCLIANSSNTNLTWTDLGSKPASALRGQRLTTWNKTRPLEHEMCLKYI
jgi:hypothetical protein